MRLVQHSANSRLRGSGLPMPPNGLVCVSWIMRRMCKAFLRSFSPHQAKSSSAAGSNSKLRSDFFKRNSFAPALGLQETLPHDLAFQQIGGFSLGFDLPPRFNWHNSGHRVAVRVRNVLYGLLDCHRFLPFSKF